MSNRSSNDLMSILDKLPFLSNVSEAEKRRLLKRLEPRKFKAGQNLMRQGELGTDFFIITEGKCQVLVTNNDGKKIEIAQLKNGDYCGEQAILKKGDCRGATVRALTDTNCLVLNQLSFEQTMQSNNVHFVKRDAKRNAVSAERINTIAEKEKKRQWLRKKEHGDGPGNETIEWLLQTIDQSILFTQLDDAQRRIVCKEMFKIEKEEDEYLCRQGDTGNLFFVIEKGEFTIYVKDVGIVEKLARGKCVGELALLYNAPRAATVQCTTGPATVWCVDRVSFRKALTSVYSSQSAEQIQYLKKCELLAPLLSSELQLIAQAMQAEDFDDGEIIMSKGDIGEKFYIIKHGNVKGIAKDGSEFKLEDGAFFGERALLTSEPRAATITAVGKLECLTLSREDFNLLLGPLDDIMKRNMKEYDKDVNERKCMHQQNKSDMCTLDKLETIGIIGSGAFSVVKLVMDPSKNDRSFALKAIRKNQVIQLGYQANVLREKQIMQMLDHPFIVKLKTTYKDEFRVYFLLEACLGGELYTVLRNRRCFDELTAKFYAGCVIEAFDYMHDRDIIFRDLKPENLVFTSNGYIKLIDFGFAKIVSSKTWTLCGTPDYLAPEIVTGQGHGKGVDWWTLGIFIYEMLVSFPPFFNDDPMMSYRAIIQGKVKFPRFLSTASKDLMFRLLKAREVRRLGVVAGGIDKIKEHSWFNDFKWKALKEQTLKAPIKNEIKSSKDMSNFANIVEKDEDLAYSGDPHLGWDQDF